MKRCRKCGVNKPVTDFSRDPSVKSGRQSVCKDCRNADRRARYRPHPRPKRPKSSVEAKAQQLFNNARQRARTAGREFSLTLNWVLDRLRNGECEVTGLPFEFTETSISPWSPSIDRTDADRGYTPENCKVTVWVYNSAKNSFSHEDVLRMAEALCFSR